MSLSKCTSVRLFPRSACDTLVLSIIVYPETMGVPLEEMDAVFGEGKISGDSERRIILTRFFTSSR
jgi:hypothetical protein